MRGLTVPLFPRYRFINMPDVTVAAELWLAGECSAEISRLLTARPDVVHSSFWGGDLVGFVEQGAPRGLVKQSLVVLTAGEHVLQDVGMDVPDGVVVGARGHPWFLRHPDDPVREEPVQGFRDRSGRYPIHSS